MDLKLGIDIQNKALLSPDGTPLTLPPLMQGDDISITLQGMERLQNGDYLRVPIDFSRIKIGIGLLDAPPLDGTFKLTVDGVSTPALAYNASKELIATKLNELSSVSSRGGIRVLEQGAANVHLLAWTNASVTTPITVTEKKLFPHCFSRVITWPQEVGTIFIVKLFQAPLAFTDAFSLPSAPPVTVVAVRSGTGTRNEIQRLNIPRDAQGEFSLTWNGLTTVIIPVAEATAVSIAAALNDLYADSVIRFKVTQPGTAYYYVEFMGPLAAAPQSLLSAAMESQQQLTTPVGNLDLKGAGMEYALSGKASALMRLEIEVTTAAGSIGTPIQREVTILNDMLDSTMSLVPDPVWLEEQRSNPVVVEYNWEEPPTFLGTIGYANNAGDGVVVDWQFVHNMGTRDVHITLRDNVTGVRVPDNEYEAQILDPNTVKILFPEAPPANRYAVLITAADVGEHFRSHHHAISDIDGLQAILNALTATGNPLDLWPTIPVEKLPAIPFAKMEGQMPANLLPPTVPLLDANGHLPITNLNPSVPRLADDGSLVIATYNAQGIQTGWREIITRTGTLSPTLYGDLSTVPAFTAAVQAVMAGLGATNPGNALTIPLRQISEVIGYRNTLPNSDGQLGIKAADLPPPRLLSPATKFDRELWRVAVNDRMLAVGRSLTIDWGVALQLLRANSAASYLCVLELGTYAQVGSPSNLAITWRTDVPVSSQLIVLTSERTVHNFGVVISRSATGLTLRESYYGRENEDNASAPANANFAIRCRLLNLQTEGNPNPRGWVSYGLVASSSPLITGASIPQAVIV